MFLFSIQLTGRKSSPHPYILLPLLLSSPLYPYDHTGDCRTGALCSPTAGYTCACRTGWGGDDCSVRFSTCEIKNPCQGGGRCLPVPGGAPDFRCDCRPGFAGALCEHNCWQQKLMVNPMDELKCISCPKNSHFRGTACGEHRIFDAFHLVH
jgi:EGF-like domain